MANGIRRISDRQTSSFPVLVSLLICLISPVSPTQADEWHFSGAERIVAIGDVHGALDALTLTLQAADVIDSDSAWIGGTTHLVFTGDLLDRGSDSRYVMDLIMRLENEARRAGGRVHLVLGNHEVMNLIGDLRYVADEEYASYREMESAQEREAWYQRFYRDQPDGSDETSVRAEFNKLAPPGYFGHRRAFRHDGHYGEWLLSKPLMIVVNDTVFVHGGIPPYVTDYGLEGVNVSLKKDLLGYVTNRALLHDAKIMSPLDNFHRGPRILLQADQAGRLPDGFRETGQAVIDLGQSPLHNSAGPTWYRGTAACSTLVEGDALTAAFERIGAKRVVMGHTSTITRQIQQRGNGRIVEIDTGMLSFAYQGSGNALIIEGEKLSVVNEDGKSRSSPVNHPLRVGHENMALDDAGLARLLKTGTITELDAGGAAWKLVQVATDDEWVFAYFRELDGHKKVVPELAAYRLDRLLGLGMIPVTVRRKIDGTRGVLQFVPGDAITERERVATRQGDEAPCGLDKQKAAMHVFDVLIGNTTRTPSTMLYSPVDWLLMLVDHENSFGPGTQRPAYLQDVDLAVGDQWCSALQSLGDGMLRRELGDVLDTQQLTALGDRRDALMAN